MSRLLAASLALVAAAPSAAAEGELQVDVARTTIVTGVALGGVVAAEIFKTDVAPTSCRVCTPFRFDASARDALVWSTPSHAVTASNVTVLAVPLLAAGAVGLAGYDAAGSRRVIEDIVVISEAVSLTMLGTDVVKFSVGRLRPYAYYDVSRVRDADSVVSLWSGHTAAAFSAAASAGQVARMRGYRNWPWIMSLGLVGASACGYFRVAGDMHWATDVIAAGVVGTAAGVGLPLLLHGASDPSGKRVQVTLSPNGITGTF